MTTTKNRPSTTVIDCVPYAWRNIDEKVQAAFYGQLDADFVHDYRAQIDAAATVLFGPVLIAVWAEHGFQVTLGGPDGLPHQRRPHNFPWHQVWDEAARRLDPHAVVIEARLDDELLRYAAAHPRPEHLARHCTALRQRSQHLRDELNARLDAHAAHAATQQAEAQLEGWRHAVETAWTRAQLEQLATDIPA